MKQGENGRGIKSHLAYGRRFIDSIAIDDSDTMEEVNDQTSRAQAPWRPSQQWNQKYSDNSFSIRKAKVGNNSENQTENEPNTPVAPPGENNRNYVDWDIESRDTIIQGSNSRDLPQSARFNWQHNFDRNPNLDAFTGPRIIDASGDSSKKEVFAEGALEISFNQSHLISLKDNHAPGFNYQGFNFDLPGWISATVSANKASTGEVVDLGSTKLDLNKNSFYVNLKDQLTPSKVLGYNYSYRRSDWRIDVDINANYATGQSIKLEEFDETITMIAPLQWDYEGRRGNETFDTLIYKNRSSYNDDYDTGQIYYGRGGTDTLVLDGIDKIDILEFNGSALHQLGNSAAGGAALGKQAFYGGTVFDVLNLNNGDELYLQGIEKISCEDGDIRVRANMSDSTKDQWNLQAMDVSGAWRFNRGSDDVVLISLDSGIGDIADNADDIDDEINHVINKSAKNTEASTSRRDHGHHSMSIMGARHDSAGIAGIAPGSELCAYQVWNQGFYGAIEDAKSDRASHQRLVFQNGVGSVEGLWGPRADYDSITNEQMTQSLTETTEYGFFSCAAGNEYSTSGVTTLGLAHFQTDFGNIASVGAVQSYNSTPIDNITNAGHHGIALSSNQGDDLTMSAPTDSLAINGDGNISKFGGTSAANANLAGVAALVWSENTDLSGSDVRDLITHSAMDLGAVGRDNTFGHGLVNAEAAVRRSYALAENNELANFYSNDEFLT